MEAKQSKDERNEKFEQNDVQEQRGIFSAAVTGSSSLIEDVESGTALEAQLWSSVFVDAGFRVGPVVTRLLWRRGDGLMGRFSGGWNWKIGFQAGGRSIRLSLLVFFVTVTYVDSLEPIG